MVEDIELGPCRFTPYCPFFNDKLADMPAMAASMKMRFCEGEYENCARYMVLIEHGPKYVPDTLFPANLEQAEQILETQKSAKK